MSSVKLYYVDDMSNGRRLYCIGKYAFKEKRLNKFKKLTFSLSIFQ